MTKSISLLHLILTFIFVYDTLTTAKKIVYNIKNLSKDVVDMADEFIALAKSTEPDIDKYLNKLDDYLQNRYSDKLKTESLWKKITKRFENKMTFTKIYEKALKLSNTLSIPKYKLTVTECLLDLVAKEKNIDDDWITSKEIQEALHIIEEKIRGHVKDYVKNQRRYWTCVKILYEIKRENLKNSGKEKNEEGQTLKKIESALTNIQNILTQIDGIVKKLGVEDEILDIEKIRQRLKIRISNEKKELPDEYKEILQKTDDPEKLKKEIEKIENNS